MAQVYTVKALSGVVFVVSATGQTRALKEGDVVLKGETIVSGPRGRVELVADDAAPIELRGEQRLQIDDSLFATSAPASESAAVASGTIERVIDTLAGGGDLTEELEAPAAGAGGGAGDDGNSFVRLLRIVEPVDPLAFDFETSLSDLPPDYPGRPVLIEEQPITEPPISPPEPPAPPAPAPGPAPSPAPGPAPSPAPAPEPTPEPPPPPTSAPELIGKLTVDLEEESVPKAGGGVIGNNETENPDLSHTTGVQTMTGAVNWGADGFGKVTGVTFGGTTVSVSGGSATVYFNALGVAQTDEAGSAAKLVVNEDGTYTLTVTGAMTHSEQGEDWLPLTTVDLVGEDKDGDPVSVPLEARVQDDAPAMVVKEPTAGIIPTFSLSYHDGAAGYNNSVGFYVKDSDGKLIGGAVLFDGVKDVPLVDRLSGTKEITLDGVKYTFKVDPISGGYTVELPKLVNDDGTVTRVTPDQIGFFLLPNGGASNTKFDLTEVQFVRSGDTWAVKMGDVVLNSDASGTASRVLFSDSALNQGGHSYVQENLAKVGDFKAGNFNWEDQAIGSYSSDKDYEDVNLTLKWGGMPLHTSESDLDPADPSKKSIATDIDSKNSSRFDVSWGADGERDLAYTFESGTDHAQLKDSVTGEAVTIRLSADKTQAFGVVGVGDSEKTVFTLSVDSSGVLTLTQERAVLHDTSNPHDIVSLGGNVLHLVATATDGDGDKDFKDFDIGRELSFMDSGPVAEDDFATVTSTSDVKFNVLRDGAGKDAYEGDANAEVVWVRAGPERSNAHTDFFEGGDTKVSVRGTLGTLSIEKDGSATYVVDAAKFKALGEVDKDKPEDKFTYQMKDADGDTDVANITVTVVGENDKPEFVVGADKTTQLWVDFNRDGKQDVGETSLDSVANDDELVLTLSEGALSAGQVEKTMVFGVVDPDIGDTPSVYFASATPKGGDVYSGGKLIQWTSNATVNDVATEVYGKVVDDAGVESSVVTVSIVPPAAGASQYQAKVVLEAPVDGSGPLKSDPLNLEFEVIARDQGLPSDTDTLALKITVVQDPAAGDAPHIVLGDDVTAPGAAGFVAADAPVATGGLATGEGAVIEGSHGEASSTGLGADVIELNLADPECVDAGAETPTDVSGADSLLIQDILSDAEGLDLSVALGDLSDADAALPVDGEVGVGADAVHPVEAQGNAPEQSLPADIALEADILTMTTTKHDPSIT